VLEFEFESIPIFPVGEFDVFHESKYVVMSTDPASKTSINITVVVVTDAIESKNSGTWISIYC
jgi:hypothetical protein